MRGKEDDIPQLFPHPVVGPFTHKEALQARFGDIGGNGLGIEAVAGTGQGVLVEVGGKDLDAEALPPGCPPVPTAAWRCIGLFARGAAGHPDTHLLVRRLVLKELGDDLLPQGLKSVWVAEESGDADEQVFEERLCFGVMPAQVAVVGREVSTCTTRMRRSIRRSTVEGL